MSSELDEMREKVAKMIHRTERLLYSYYELPSVGYSWDELPDKLKGAYLAEAHEILSLSTDSCRIAVVGQEGKLPKDPFTHKLERFDYHKSIGWMKCWKAMLDAGFVQEAKDA